MGWSGTGERPREGEVAHSSMRSHESFSGRILPWRVRNGDGKSCSQKWVIKVSAEKTHGSLVYLGAGWRDFLCVYNFLLFLDLYLKGNLYSKGKGHLSSQNFSPIHRPMSSMKSKRLQCFLSKIWHGRVACRNNSISSMPFQLRSVQVLPPVPYESCVCCRC